MKIDLDKLKSNLLDKISNSVISSQILLGKCRLSTESSRNTSAFTDPNYFPFYYHLGSLVPAENLMEIGFDLGLPSRCFLQGSKTVKSFFGFHESQNDVFYSDRMARGNIKDCFKGEIDSFSGRITDGAFLKSLHKKKWDVVIIDVETGYDKHLTFLDLMWSNLSSNGLLVVDYLEKHESSRKAFDDFCKTRNREATLLPTRYGVGIIQR